MHRIINAEALGNYRLRLAFEDGTQGVADLSDLAGRGVFALWDDYAEFEKVRIGETGEVVWSDQVDLCADALYLKVTGKKPEDIFPALSREMASA